MKVAILMKVAPIHYPLFLSVTTHESSLLLNFSFPFSSVIVGLSPPSYPKRHKRLVLCTGFLGNESTGDGGQDWQGLKDTKDAKFVPGTT